jgi:hypothetical protein
MALAPAFGIQEAIYPASKSLVPQYLPESDEPLPMNFRGPTPVLMGQIDAAVANTTEEVDIVNLRELANWLEDLLPTGNIERLPPCQSAACSLTSGARDGVSPLSVVGEPLINSLQH